jgi:tRNA(fMet)-specific endonuclease VapC
MNRRWMLDTNIVSDTLRNPTGAVVRRLLPQEVGDCCISIVTLSELRFGAMKVASSRLTQQIDQFVQLVPVMAFEQPAELAYASLRVALQAAGRPIGPVDMFIAAHALSLDLTLVTANVREFSRVPGLKVENWLD